MEQLAAGPRYMPCLLDQRLWATNVTDIGMQQRILEHSSRIAIRSPRADCKITRGGTEQRDTKTTRIKVATAVADDK